MISAVVLAAGRAERMGEQKLFLPLRDKPVLQWVLESALRSSVHEVICVVRDLGTVRQRISLGQDRLYWLVNHAADHGQSTSVVAGLWAVDPRSEGALFLVGDQPNIGGPKSVVAPETGIRNCGRRHHTVYGGFHSPSK